MRYSITSCDKYHISSKVDEPITVRLRNSEASGIRGGVEK
jgi:hypothetical protein